MSRIVQGTILAHSTDCVIYTDLVELTEVGEFGLGEADDIDTTTHDSADGYREFTRGLVDAGEITFSGNWIADSSQELPATGSNTGISTGPTTTLDYFRITLPDSLGVWAGRGYWKSWRLNPQLDGLMTFAGSIKVSGKPTFTA